MASLEKWNENYDNIIQVVRKKLQLYIKDISRYEKLIPRDKILYKDRIQELRDKIKFYQNVLYNDKHSELALEDEMIGDILVSANSKSKDMVETEYGDFPIVYKKSKQELIDEYYKVITNLNNSKKNDSENRKKYKDLSEKYYFRYALLVDKAPLIRKGIVQNQKLDPSTIENEQEFINEHVKNKRLAVVSDFNREELVSKSYELQEQLMNFSNKNGIEKNKLRIDLANLKCKIIELKKEHNNYEYLSSIALLKLQAVRGKFSKEYYAYLYSKLDAENDVNVELLNVEYYSAAIEKNDSELRLIALNSNTDEEKRSELLKKDDSLQQLKNKAESDLSKARKNRLKRDILHAYNVGSISLQEKIDKLSLLDSYIVINESVEKEINVYINDREKDIKSL